ncbi:LLM class flavin-dependent oxidoreductase [Actinoplanes sp. NBRC 101535]|uniref:LLM class flavin-dependent oxidoreductase n=1 Tax=Actinoplanes sp. NBRC 101535 TaxID=3032196 RepID=UPI0024A4D1D5|nr:LLM class flavin-dependent oxidoreductase [Actinoplanes sp. NBRC 101535]GLY02513.1 monooxygenase [Actinoplanes sp. NBRC 101535]
MSVPVQIALSVGGAGLVSPADAVRIAAAAEAAGVVALRLTDTGAALDPTVVAAYLAGIHGGIGYLPELPTTGNAPFNAARRILSLDRATGGRAGVVLRPGRGDAVSELTAPEPGLTDPVRRWGEYAHILTRLWESFPREALIGDRDAGVLVDDALIRPIGHEGAHYRVAGPLDGPSSVQGRPVLVADLGVLDLATVAAVADVVVVDLAHAAEVDAALRTAGRARDDITLIGRVTEIPDPAWRGPLDGFELAVTGGADEILAAIAALEPRPPAATLRGAYQTVAA